MRKLFALTQFHYRSLAGNGDIFIGLIAGSFKLTPCFHCCVGHIVAFAASTEIVSESWAGQQSSQRLQAGKSEGECALMTSLAALSW
jgi:hypothetical protein